MPAQVSSSSLRAFLRVSTPPESNEHNYHVAEIRSPSANCLFLGLSKHRSLAKTGLLGPNISHEHCLLPIMYSSKDELSMSAPAVVSLTHETLTKWISPTVWASETFLILGTRPLPYYEELELLSERLLIVSSNVPNPALLLFLATYQYSLLFACFVSAVSIFAFHNLILLQFFGRYN